MEELTKIECEKDGERWEEIRVKEYFIAGFNLKTCKFIAIMINMNLNLLLNYVHKDCPDGSSKDGHLQEMVKFRCLSLNVLTPHSSQLHNCTKWHTCPDCPQIWRTYQNSSSISHLFLLRLNESDPRYDISKEGLFIANMSEADVGDYECTIHTPADSRVLVTSVYDPNATQVK